MKAESDWVLIDAPAWACAADSVPLADCCGARRATSSRRIAAPA